MAHAAEELQFNARVKTELIVIDLNESALHANSSQGLRVLAATALQQKACLVFEN